MTITNEEHIEILTNATNIWHEGAVKRIEEKKKNLNKLEDLLQNVEESRSKLGFIGKWLTKKKLAEVKESIGNFQVIIDAEEYALKKTLEESLEEIERIKQSK